MTFSLSFLPTSVRAFAFAAVIAAPALVAPAHAETASGTWRLSNGKITVRVQNCNGDKLCATIVGMSQPLTKDGKPKVDKDNPNPALRSRPIIGLRVVDGMVPAGENRWKGTIYNADDGRTYSGTAEISGNQLVIKACILGGLACKRRNFTRVN